MTRTLAALALFALLAVPAAAQTQKPKPQPAPAEEPPSLGMTDVPQPAGTIPSSLSGEYVTVSKLNTFPKDYVGKTVVLGMVRLSGPEPEDGAYLFSVSGDTGSVGSRFSSDGISFVAEEGLARKMEARAEGGTLLAWIQCDVLAVHWRGGTYHTAVIRRVENVNLKGDVVWSATGSRMVQSDSEP